MNSKIFLNLSVIVILFLPTVALAIDNFVPLVGIPGVDGNADFNTYINALYALSISLAGLLAVIKIIIAGVKWMLSDVVTSKQEAKSDMQGALIGLLIVISAVLILNIINPQLTETRLYVGAVDSVPNRQSAPATPGAPSAPGSVLNPNTKTCADGTVNPTTGAKSYNCDIVSSECTALGGTVLPYNRLGPTDPAKIICNFD